MHTLKSGVLQVLSGGVPAEREADRHAKRDLLALFLRTYRKLGDADDAELYIESLAYALADYPVDIVRTVLHPNGSLRRQHRYVPDYSELAKALATEQEWRERQRDRDERIHAQLDEREQRERELATKPEQTRGAFAAEMRDRGLPIAPRVSRAAWSAPPMSTGMRASTGAGSSSSTTGPAWPATARMGSASLGTSLYAGRAMRHGRASWRRGSRGLR